MKKGSAILAAAKAVACGGSPSRASIEDEPSGLRGVSLAGAEFGEQNLPGVYREDDTYPTAATSRD
jgi:hypothetical protein